MKTISKITLGAGLLTAIAGASVPLARADSCNLSLTPFGELYAGEAVSDSTRAGRQRVDFVAFVGDASLDLVGTNVTDVTFGTKFAIQSAPTCTGSAFGDANVVGDSRFDDAIVRCGFLSIPESLIGAIGVLGTLDRDGETCKP